MRTLPRMSLVTTLTMTFAACITVNIYFPAPQVRAAAEEIVEETWGNPAGSPGAKEPGDAAPEGAPASGGPSALFEMLGPRSAWAQQHPDIEIETAAIRALKANMKGRAAELKPYMAKGHVGIGKDGMLVVRDASALPLSDQAKVRRLVEAENRDRKALYEEIAEANGFPRDRIKDIQDIFAETWIDKAEKGWSIQKSDGSWAKK